jgi:DNA repair protein RAD16
VYRHLQCAVFSEEVVTAKDVGGYKKLNKQDFKLLVERVEESKIEVQKENEELHPDELVNVGFQGEMRSPPPGLTATMLPFQVEGASWMYHQEVHVPEARGGILAGMSCVTCRLAFLPLISPSHSLSSTDEMGLGKTLQSIVAILDNRPLLQHCKPGCKHPPSSPDLTERAAEEKLWDECTTEWKQEMDLMDVPKHLIPKPRGKQPGGGARAGTLVVCPVIALSQWKSEIEKFTEHGTLTVGIYHGPKRASETPRELMLKYDVVLTTYQVLEHDFRKMTSPNKVKCPNCGGKYKVCILLVPLSLTYRIFCV